MLVSRFVWNERKQRTGNSTIAIAVC